MRGVAPDQSRHCRIGTVTFKPGRAPWQAYHKDFPNDAYWLRESATVFRRVSFKEFVRKTR
ncbi:hypothetical protein ACVIRO_001287 [Rhizobium ruizarguesonis]